MKNYQKVAAVLAWGMVPGGRHVQAAEGPKITAEEFEAKLGYQTGTVQLPGGMTTIRLPPSFRYIGADGSRRLLTQA